MPCKDTEHYTVYRDEQQLRHSSSQVTHRSEQPFKDTEHYCGDQQLRHSSSHEQCVMQDHINQSSLNLNGERKENNGSRAKLTERQEQRNLKQKFKNISPQKLTMVRVNLLISFRFFYKHQVCLRQIIGEHDVGNYV